MFWSISESKTFKRCQRQWYFKNVLANANAREHVRRTAYLLGKLQSISAWRGAVVDSIITTIVIPSIQGHRSLSLDSILRSARTLFNRQLQYARDHSTFSDELRPAQEGDDFLLLYALVYEGRISSEQIEQAWQDVKLALANLLTLEEILSDLRRANYIVTQRALAFSHSGMTVRAVPDVIAFYSNEPPLILDWKVHTFGFGEAWTQLAVYALSLFLCKPHKDFPSNLQEWKPTDVRLAEVQLLISQVRRYTLTPDDCEHAENYIASSATSMQLVLDSRKNADLATEEFLVAENPQNCQRCPYRRICWEATA